jgi:hypothetical protein
VPTACPAAWVFTKSLRASPQPACHLRNAQDAHADGSMRIMQAAQQVQVLRAAVHRRCAVLRSAWRLWLELINEAVALEHAADHNSTVLARKAMSAWCAYNAHRARVFDLQCQARSFCFISQCTRALQAWRAHCAAKARRRTLQAHAVVRLAHTCRRRVFRAWVVCAWVRLSPEQRILWDHAAEHHASSCARSVVASWHAWVRRGSTVLHWTSCCTLSADMLCLHKSHAASIHPTCDKASNHRIMVPMQARRSKHKRSLFVLAEAHWRIGRLQLAVRLWCSHASDRAPARAHRLCLLEQHAAAARARLLRGAWEAWRERHQGWLVQKVLAGRAVVHHGMALRSRALCAWAAWAGARQQERRAVCAALSHWRMRVCGDAFARWARWQQEHAELRCATCLDCSNDAIGAQSGCCQRACVPSPEAPGSQAQPVCSNTAGAASRQAAILVIVALQGMVHQHMAAYLHQTT